MTSKYELSSHLTDAQLLTLRCQGMLLTDKCKSPTCSKIVVMVFAGQGVVSHASHLHAGKCYNVSWFI